MTWSVNGRFFSQPTTGVQRFAREILSAIDTQAGAGQFNLIVPANGTISAKLNNIQTLKSSFGKGQIWEQAILPKHIAAGCVSLCNTAPIIVKNQVVCIHDANVWTYPSSYGQAFRTYYKLLLPILGRRARKIITVSRSSADALVSFDIVPANKIEIVSNGYEHTKSWDPSRSNLFENMSPSRPFIFAVGSNAPHKNLDLLFKIAPSLDENGIDIYVSGGSFGIFSPVEHRNFPNVKMLGYVSDDDLAALYNNAICLAFPSFVEGFGIPLLEAMAFGCPIVSSNTSCMPEIAGGYARFASPSDPQEWVKQILELHSEVSSKREISPHALRFSWSQSAKTVLEICKALDG